VRCCEGELSRRISTTALGGHRIDHNSDHNAFGACYEDDATFRKLSELVDAVERREEVVSITRNGKPVAMIVSKEEYESWHETMEIMRDANLMREIRKGIHH
jgi:prevent-host-death family protein